MNPQLDLKTARFLLYGFASKLAKAEAERDRLKLELLNAKSADHEALCDALANNDRLSAINMDLLAALQDLCARYNMASDPAHESGVFQAQPQAYREAWIAARAAIAKAAVQP